MGQTMCEKSDVEDLRANRQKYQTMKHKTKIEGILQYKKTPFPRSVLFQ